MEPSDHSGTLGYLRSDVTGRDELLPWRLLLGFSLRHEELNVTARSECWSTFCLCKHGSPRQPEHGTRDSASVEEYYTNGLYSSSRTGGGGARVHDVCVRARVCGAGRVSS
ncbi:hypothetical protein NQZ68_027609 [Dissostichus eleginoides]|nr:hypothetical protein NQZ68_027609 [Dissostichus eleginoides]